jgi:6-phosphogluconolactonase (cycloisomerase 2 family)
LHINNSTGVITTGAETPLVINASPTGLAILPSKKFVYAVNSNSHSNSISVFKVAGDGSLTLSGTPTPAGDGPNNAVVDPSGQYLLVTNNFGNSVSVYSIDTGSGALSEVGGSPFPANANPSEIVIVPSGKFVYVTNPGIGTVTGFTFSSGTLTQVPGSPKFSGAGAFGLAVDSSERFLYVANPSAPNPLQTNTGNVSGFTIDPNTGALTSMQGSPFSPTTGNAPLMIAVDPNGRFVYAVTTGSSSSVWCFVISSTTGQLTLAQGSPFSVSAGGLFALIDPDGNHLYIGSPTGNGVAGYSYSSATGVPTAITGSPFPTVSTPGKMVLSQ